MVHAADIVWPAFISIFAEGPRSPFFLFFVFVLTAAAYRWGLWETLSTAAAEVVLLWVESFALLHVPFARGEPALANFFRPANQYHRVRAQTTIHVVGLSAGDGVVAGLSGGAAKTSCERKRPGSRACLRRSRVESGLTGTLQQICQEVVSMYGAARMLIAAQEIHSQRRFLGEVSRVGKELSDFKWLDSRPADAKIYLGGFSGRCMLRGERRETAGRWSR